MEMNSLNRYFLFFLLVLISSSYQACLPAAEKINTYDIVIYGATPSGIIAGIAAAKEGSSVIIIEPGQYIGGMVAGGLGRTDVSGRQYVGGYAAKYFNEVASYTPQEQQTPGRPWDLEAKVAAKVFDEWISASGCKTLKGHRLKSVVKDGNVLQQIILDNGEAITAKVFIDASYEGDLMAAAGVSYTTGRESTSTYNESVAGFYNDSTVKYRDQDYNEPCACLGGKSDIHYLHNTQLGADIPAYFNGELLHGVNKLGNAMAGHGDSLTQAYNFRITATQRADLKVDWPKPDNYYPLHYEVLLKYIRAHPGIRFSRLVHFGRLPNGKFDINANGPFTTDYVGGNTGYPDGDPLQRKTIWQDHKDYCQGFFWFLATDERVPAALRKEVNEWGLCKDEFTLNNHWPYQLYIREARRMKGVYIMKQKDITTDIFKNDAVGMGSFSADSHPVQRWANKEGYVREEGHFLLPTKPYQIPFRCLAPTEKECNNLLVPVCLSTSHVAYGSIRMEPVYMVMGHAAGIAASQAIKENKAIQQIDIQQLQMKLLAQGQILGQMQTGK